MPKADAPVSPRQRGPALESLRNQKMARSALDYVRGSPMQFYEWLEKGSAAIPQGPEVWICGDCHVGNLGPIANADGRFKVEIRDFDQTVIGKPAHDLIRLGLSLAAAAVVSDLPGLTIAEILEAMIAQYEAAFHARSTAKRRPGLRAIWRRSWGRRTGGKCRATIEGRGIRNCGATVRKRSMRPRGSGGASSISSLTISAAILSTAVRCHPLLETWVPYRF
jgi:uncharacterized protein (DUF2252 family)